jgi:hypothetical protein
VGFWPSLAARASLAAVSLGISAARSIGSTNSLVGLYGHPISTLLLKSGGMPTVLGRILHPLVKKSTRVYSNFAKKKSSVFDWFRSDTPG